MSRFSHRTRTTRAPVVLFDAGEINTKRKELIMTDTIVHYEDIEKTPAAELLELEHEQLDALIKGAERAAYRADTVVHWLRGIKVEKTFREAGKRPQGGKR